MVGELWLQPVLLAKCLQLEVGVGDIRNSCLDIIRGWAQAFLLRLCNVTNSGQHLLLYHSWLWKHHDQVTRV